MTPRRHHRSNVRLATAWNSHPGTEETSRFRSGDPSRDVVGTHRLSFAEEHANIIRICGWWSRDFIGLQETHSTAGRAAAFSTEFMNKYTSFWSHLSKRQGGVGIIVKNTFLVNFSGTPIWLEIVPGRIAMLTLSGPSGSLNLVVCYLDATSSSSRGASVDALAPSMQPGAESLNIVFGDFNFVEHDEDRISKYSGEFTGANNKQEARHFDSVLLDKQSLVEWSQTEYTCEMAAVRSRIDRCYSNMALSELQDRNVECIALAWPYGLSTHRPIHFARTKQGHRNGSRPINLSVVNHPDFVRTVEDNFAAHLFHNSCPTCSLTQLGILKDAIRATARDLATTTTIEVTSIEEKISCSIGALRAAQSGQAEVVRASVQKYARLHTFFPEESVHLSSSALQELQEHIVELCRYNVQARVEELRDLKPSLPDYNYAVLKESILVQMKRLVPGSTTASIGGVQDETNTDILTEAEDIAHMLSKHWQAVFDRKEIDRPLLERWLSRIGTTLPFSGANAEYTPSLTDVEEAIQESRDSAPGPDKIPARAWKRLRELAAPLLHQVLLQLRTTSADQLRSVAPHFNEAFLSCLGKKPVCSDEEHGHVFTPSGTRPLSVVNADSRILASALRRRISPLMEGWISGAQRGFIKGRYLLNNVVEIDWEAMKVSWKSSRGAIILYDFQAAFPSVSQEYIWRTLEVLRVPQPLLQMLQSFYVDNVHTIKVKGRCFPSIVARSGIRQGCPLSPLIFAVVVDVLLRRLADVFSGDAIKAFADDIGMVVQNFDKVADRLAFEFCEFGRISNLHLGMSKTIVMPLWNFNHGSFVSYLRDTFPFWSRARVMVGPGKSSRSWDSPLKKYRERSRIWSKLPVGLLLSIQNYKTFVFSVLSFVQQVEHIPDRLFSAEAEALRRFAPGPGNWIMPGDLYNLVDLFGFPMSFPSLRTSALAAKLRVLAYEVTNASQMMEDLRTMLLDFPVLPLQKDWYEQCHVKVLLQARSEAAALGVTHHSITTALRLRAPKGKHESDFIRSRYQAEAYSQLMQKGANNFDPEQRHRCKQQRWKLQAPPRITASRAVNLFKRLAKLVKPRVLASVAKTHWNGWATRRRFQQEGPCVFQCAPTAADSIEHYPFCPIFRDFSERVLHIPRFAGLHDFLLLDHRLWSDSLLTVFAIAVHALYTTFNHARLSASRPKAYWTDFMERSSYHATCNHRSANALSLALSNTAGWWR